MANYISSLVVNYKDTKQLKYGVNNICDNTTYYGSTTWSVIDNGGITGLAVDGLTHDGVTLSSNDDKYLVITNTYTGTNADPMIRVKASSDLVSCDSNNTCLIGIYRACWHQSVICEVEINDDSSKNYVTSITGQNAIDYGINSSMGYAVIVPVSQIGNNTTGKETVGIGNCSSSLSSGDKIYFNFDNININASLSNNVQNVSVSGEVKYKFGDDTYTTLDSLSSDIYTYTSTSNSISITGCNYKTTQLHDLMDGFKTLYIKHIINLKYDDEVIEKEYIIIFKKNELTIESVESKPMPKIYTFDVYYRPKDSFEEQSASGIIRSVSSSSTYYTPTFKFTSNTVTLAQNISDGDVIPDDIEFDVKVCIKPSDASSNICNSLPVHFINKSPIVSEKISVTIKWSISCSNNLMLYQNNTSIDVDLNNEVNSSNTSGSITKTYISGTTSTNISINFSMKGAGYSGNNNYKGKKVITAISCNSIMDPSSKSGTYTGCCLSETGEYIMFTNGGINCTSTFNNVAISDGDTIFIDINLGIEV